MCIPSELHLDASRGGVLSSSTCHGVAQNMTLSWVICMTPLSAAGAKSKIAPVVVDAVNLDSNHNESLDLMLDAATFRALRMCYS